MVDADRGAAGVLAKLEPGQRDVLFLHVWAGLSYEEIASSLGVALGTVSSRLSRARAGLRAELGSASSPSAPSANQEEAR
jgi:DNA-directed RNA polymerase specialized sigma24 family protein